MQKSYLSKLAVILLMVMFAGITPHALSQQQVQIEKPVTEMRSAMAITYPEDATIRVKFQGTRRLPQASGEAKIQRKKGTTEIDIELDEMKPAALFGGDFATYVLWTVSPEGHVANAGEFVLKGNESRLGDVSTPLQTFGMFVTAEPHFLVDTPSRFVVMENTRPEKNITSQIIKVSTIKYRGFDGIYDYSAETLTSEPEAKGEVRSDVRQARVAVELAERAGAEEFAAEELALAKGALEKTFLAAEARVAGPHLATLGHDTVRLAVEAEKRARERAFQAALDSERRASAQEISSLATGIKEAQSEAERARLLAQQKQLQLELEQRAREAAQEKAAEEARAALEEARRRRDAEEQAQKARLEAERAAREKLDAEMRAGLSEQEAERARRERDEARARLKSALSVVVETRETARGLVVNLPDILFDFDKATLKPEARELLSKVCGIMLAAGQHKLSIEGHTDSVGTDDYNQRLSERRAESVRTYLAGCGLSSALLSSKGFGETQPIVSNDTAEDRQRNRRVEIVIEDGGDFPRPNGQG